MARLNISFFKTLREEQYDYVFDTQGLLKTGVIMGAACLKPGGSKVGLAITAPQRMLGAA